MGQPAYTSIGILASPFLPPAAVRLASPPTFECGREQPTQSTIDRSNVCGHITACSSRDESKNQHNLEKHGIAFEDVLSVFANSEALALEDKRRDYGEPRYVVLCPLQDVLIHVTYTVRGGNIRLISAQRASRREKRDYERRKHDQSRADAGRPRAH
jgi:uncharacterized protein